MWLHCGLVAFLAAVLQPSGVDVVSITKRQAGTPWWQGFYNLRSSPSGARSTEDIDGKVDKLNNGDYVSGSSNNSDTADYDSTDVDNANSRSNSDIDNVNSRNDSDVDKVQSKYDSDVDNMNSRNDSHVDNMNSRNDTDVDNVNSRNDSDVDNVNSRNDTDVDNGDTNKSSKESIRPKSVRRKGKSYRGSRILRTSRVLKTNSVRQRASGNRKVPKAGSVSRTTARTVRRKG
ncbi:clumping factor A-like [Haliotis rufescens]|uniref:clumping factor A-like n=1 Tax=Haliotis rufescens TaxID=6454 RepID=UPI00201ED16F|nr:clumping factor A-like [Haliotis rufescens]